MRWRRHALLVLLWVVGGNAAPGAWHTATTGVPPAPPVSRVAGGATTAAVQCSFSLGETSASVPSTPTTRTVSVVTGTSCSWTAVSHVSWITVTGGASGTGLGWVTFSVASNPGSSPRVGTLTIAGITYTVTQAANSCSYSLGETSASVPASASTRTISVVTGTACSWTAVSHVSWITVTGGASGTGLGWVTLSIAANSGSSSRVGTVTIAGITYTVTQAPGSSCSYALSPTSASVPAAATTGTVSVTAAAGCSWAAVSHAGWITITSGASGSGGGVVAYAVAAHSGSTQRSGTLTIAGQPFTVTQAAAGPIAPRNIRIVP